MANRHVTGISWSEGPEFPDMVKGGAMGVAGGVVVYAGGMTYPWRESEAAWWLDREAEDWSPVPPLPIGLAYTTGASSEDGLFVVGGRRKGKPRSDCYRLLRRDESWSWEALPHLNHPRGVPAVAYLDGSLYAIGGGSWGRGCFLPDDVPGDEALDLGDDRWIQIPRCPGRRRANSFAAAVDGSVYVFGGVYSWMEGERQSVTRLRDAWRFTPDTYEWEELDPLPVPGLSGAAAIACRDRYIIILGGAVPVREGAGECKVLYLPDEKRGVKVGWYNETILVYDVKRARYDVLDGGLPWPAHDIRAAVADETIYAVGGETVDASTSNTCSKVRVGKIRVECS